MRHPLYPRGALCDCLPNGRLGRHHLAAAARGACFCSVRLHHRRRVRSVSTGSLLARCLRPCDHDPTFLHLGRHHEPLRRLRVLQRGGYLQQWRVQRPRGQPLSRSRRRRQLLPRCATRMRTAIRSRIRTGRCAPTVSTAPVRIPVTRVSANSTTAIPVLAPMEMATAPSRVTRRRSRLYGGERGRVGLYGRPLLHSGRTPASGGSCTAHTGDPCAGPDGDGNCSESCNEVANSCTAADEDGSACTDGLFCSGGDSCSGGSCTAHAGDPCPASDGDGNCSEWCDEAANSCTAADVDGSVCTDGLFCSGGG